MRLNYTPHHQAELWPLCSAGERKGPAMVSRRGALNVLEHVLLHAVIIPGLSCIFLFKHVEPSACVIFWMVERCDSSFSNAANKSESEFFPFATPSPALCTFPFHPLCVSACANVCVCVCESAPVHTHVLVFERKRV